jgi:DNA-binding GntR family transcriptional regulator
MGVRNEGVSVSSGKQLVGLTVLDRSASLGERAYDQLKESIIGGAFPQGQQLTVRSVADSLGMSTTPARDAINRLIADGALVNAGPKTVVVPRLTLESLREVTGIRLALEGLAAEKATAAFTPADIEALESLQTLINRGLDEQQYKEVLRHNKAFHFAIYSRSGFPRLVAMIESLWLLIGPSFHNLYPEYAVTRYGASNHHAAIVALKEKDAAAARAAIESDIREGYRRLSSFLTHSNRD